MFENGCKEKKNLYCPFFESLKRNQYTIHQLGYTPKIIKKRVRKVIFRKKKKKKKSRNVGQIAKKMERKLNKEGEKET